MSYKYELLLESRKYKNFEVLVETSFPRLTATYIKAFFKNILKAYKEGIQTGELESERIKKLNNYFNQIAELSKEHQNLKNIYTGEELKLKEQEVLNKIDALHKSFAINDAGLTQQEVNQVITNSKNAAVRDPQASIISDEDIDRLHANSAKAHQATVRIAALKENNTMNNKLILSEQRLKQIINEETYNVLAEAGFLDRFPGINNALQKLKSGEIDKASLNTVNISNIFNEFTKINTLLNTLNISSDNLNKILNGINDPAIKTATQQLNAVYDTYSNTMKEFNYLIAQKFPDDPRAKQLLANLESEKLAFTQKSQQNTFASQAKYLNKAFNRANELLNMQKGSGQVDKALNLNIQDVEKVIKYLMKTNQYKLVEQEEKLTGISGEKVAARNTEFGKLVSDIVKNTGVKEQIATVILNALVNLNAFGGKKIDTGTAAKTSLDPKLNANLQKTFESFRPVINNIKNKNDLLVFVNQIFSKDLGTTYKQKANEYLKTINYLFDQKQKINNNNQFLSLLTDYGGFRDKVMNLVNAQTGNSVVADMPSSIKEHLKKRNNYELLRNQLLNQKENYA